MSKTKNILIVLGIIIAVMFVAPVTVIAVSSGDAVVGLKEYYALLILLAQKGIEGYIEFLKVL